MKKQQDIVKKFTFSKEERDQLQNIQIGIINAQATNDGLQFYKKALLNSAYKRCGIETEAKKGFDKDITYSLADNVITVVERPSKKEMLVKK